MSFREFAETYFGAGSNYNPVYDCNKVPITISTMNIHRARISCYSNPEHIQQVIQIHRDTFFKVVVRLIFVYSDTLKTYEYLGYSEIGKRHSNVYSDKTLIEKSSHRY